MKMLFALPVLALTLTACEGATKVRSAVYGKAAEVGNKYCDTRDADLRDDAVTRINLGLREEGARFTFDGVTCDE